MSQEESSVIGERTGKMSAKATEIELLRQKKEAYLAKVKGAVNELSLQPAGQILLRHLFLICGQALASRVVDPQTGEINPYSTVYNDGRRSVYTDIRALVKPENVNAIENEGGK